MREPGPGTGPVTDLLRRASAREVVVRGDGKSGSTFEQLVVDGASYFLKRLSPATDWIMRATGDHVHRPYLIWRDGIMDHAPACIDHTVVAMELSGEGDTAELSMLMRDVGAHLVPEGDTVVEPAQHGRFIDHMAQLAATFWGFRDESGLLATMRERLRFFAPDNIAAELSNDPVPGPIAAADDGWRLLAERSPLLDSVARLLHDRPQLLTDILARTPLTFLQGDWKMGNLGEHPDGRTILLDWAIPGSGPACWDLCWYLALNRARLPHSKEATIARFFDSLERCGIETRAWRDLQLEACMVGIIVTFGWEKALGDEEELRWWEHRVAMALRRPDLAALRPPG